ncbi:MAG: hypothetical protein ACR2L6_09345 [Gemmatimonadaceae bacterium]
MKPILLLSTTLMLAFASARSAEAQSAPAQTTACDSLSAQCARLSASADSALRELERAAAELARAVEQTVRQTANNPEIRLTALKLAAGALAIAQQTLIQNADVLERMLAEASRQMASAQAALEARSEAAKKP